MLTPTEISHLQTPVLLTLDLMGTFVFAISGGAAAVRARLDLFGVIVLSIAAGTAGGVTRDLLIGAIPPEAISDWRYVGAAIPAGFVTFYWPRLLDRLRNPVLVFDAAGLALFAVAGTQKALAFGLSPAMAAALGMVTGIGGGMVRDLLIVQIPVVLRADLYALAALAGAAAVVVCNLWHVPAAAAAIIGVALCFGLRTMAIYRGWRLPSARPSGHESAAELASEKDDVDKP
jgi:uncharacterized membrane protein YeiH